MVKLFERTTRIEIHETKYRGRKTLRLRSMGGYDREIDLVRLIEKRGIWTLESIGLILVLPEDTAKKYYSNMKASYLRTFGIREGSA